MSRPTPIGLVADGQQLFGYGLAALLERHLGLSPVVNAHSFAEAAQLLSAHPTIGIAAFDLTLAGLGGLQGIADLRVAYPELRLVVVADSTRREDILGALAVGIHGYLPRSITQIEAIQALQTIAEGHIYVPTALSDVQEAPLAAAVFSDSANHTPLTARQYQVMIYLAQGKTNRQIARELGLAEGTVKVHVNAVFRALNVHDRAGVAALAAARGWKRS